MTARTATKGQAHGRAATTNRQYAVALGRAFAGAVIFSVPLLMTMEMWWLGFYLEPWRLLQFTLANMVLLYFLSRVAGFEESHNWLDDILDAFAAYAVAVAAAAGWLWLIGVIRPHMPLAEIAGMVAVQAVPASFGAMIGAKLLGEGDEIERQEQWRDTYSGRMFLMLAGALFLGFTVAPTEEMILIAYQMSAWQGLALVILSIAVLHSILYLVGFAGQKARSEPGGAVGLLRHSLPGYAIAVCGCLYILWSFGRVDGSDPHHIAMSLAVLGFPASIGAGIARIVV
ncbi:TIGR02587 family membrane protein [Sphingomonas sp.]|uniref:TIGR02587 family membrane protein n=1 Tax=Sphingomonas sp. TaxID=28214 RepID=UPI00286E37AE|nr:TIGR02587 family membrane protein [Sphingomonas sp.]